MFIAFIVTWMLTPRGNNHSTLSEEDLVFIYCIMNKIKINWIHVFKEHMLNSIRLCDYHYPYAILITKFLHYFEVDLEDEQFELVKTTSEFNNGSLSRMRFTKVNGRWVGNGSDHVGSSSGAHVEYEDEDQPHVDATEGDAEVEAGEDGVGAYEVGQSAGNMGERITSMSPFERLMLSRMNSFVDEQRSHHEFCVSRFQDLDEQIEVVQNQLFELQCVKDD